MTSFAEQNSCKETVYPGLPFSPYWGCGDRVAGQSVVRRGAPITHRPRPRQSRPLPSLSFPNTSTPCPNVSLPYKLNRQDPTYDRKNNRSVLLLLFPTDFQPTSFPARYRLTANKRPGPGCKSSLVIDSFSVGRHRGKDQSTHAL